MPYCTRADLIAEFGETELVQLTDAEGLGVINDVALDTAIANADEEINGYLAGVAGLPLAGGFMRLRACTITRYYLYRDAVPPEVSKRYDAAIKYLEQVGQGKISVATDAGEVLATTGGAQFTSGGNAFERGDW